MSHDKHAWLECTQKQMDDLAPDMVKAVGWGGFICANCGGKVFMRKACTQQDPVLPDEGCRIAQPLADRHIYPSY